MASPSRTTIPAFGLRCSIFQQRASWVHAADIHAGRANNASGSFSGTAALVLGPSASAGLINNQ